MHRMHIKYFGLYLSCFKCYHQGVKQTGQTQYAPNLSIKVNKKIIV